MEFVLKIKTVVFLSVLLAVSCFAKGQTVYIDSIRNVIRIYEQAGGQNKELIRNLNQLSLELVYLNPDESEVCLKKAMSHALKSNHPRQISAVYYTYGQFYKLRGKYPAALDNFFKSYEQNIQYNEPSTVGYILIDIGNVYFALENYKSAEKFYNRALNNFVYDEKVNGSSVAMNNIGLVKLKLHDYDSALVYFRKVLEERKLRNEYPIPVGLNYAYVGKAFLGKMRYEESLNYLNLALQTLSTADSNQLEVSTIVGDIYFDKALVNFKTDDHIQAFHSLSLSENCFHRIGDRKGIAKIYKLIAEHYLDSQEYTLASQWVDSLLIISDSEHLTELSAAACYLKSLICLKTNDLNKAQDYLSRYYKLKEQIESDLRSSSVQQMDVAMETLAREREADLKRENSRQISYYLVFAIGIIVIIAIVILRLFLSKRKQEKRFRQLSNSTFEGLVIHDRHKVIDFNEKMLSILGTTASEIKKMNPMDFIHVDFHKLMSTMVAGSSDNYYEIEIVRKNGERLPVELLTRIFDESKGLRIVAVREIAKEKLTRFALQESERKLDTLLANLPGMAYRCKNDKDWTMEFVSNGCFKLTGYKPEELLNNKVLSFNEIISPEFRDYLWRKWQQVLEQKTIFEDEYSIITATGEVKWVWESGNGVFNEKGELLALEGFIMDISEQKSAISDIIKSEKVLKESNATKDKFFSIIAHDLKGPLHALQGFSELLKDGYTDYSDEDRMRYIRNIHEVAEQLNKLLQNLLDWSRSKTGRIEFHPENKYLSLIVKSTSDLLFEQARAKNITIVSKVTADVRVFCDENMMQTVIRNLISNAIKFTFPGGRILVEADNRSSEVLISVADNGIGIPKSQITKLFRIDEVYKTDGTNKEKGTGLGLILCREFVEKNNGRIWAESDPGKGSRFYITLPKSK